MSAIDFEKACVCFFFFLREGDVPLVAHWIRQKVCIYSANNILPYCLDLSLEKNNGLIEKTIIFQRCLRMWRQDGTARPWKSFNIHITKRKGKKNRRANKSGKIRVTALQVWQANTQMKRNNSVYRQNVSNIGDKQSFSRVTVLIERNCLSNDTFSFSRKKLCLSSKKT